MPTCSARIAPVPTADEPLEPDRAHSLGRLRIRPLRPAEDAPLRRVFEGLSPQSRFLRYQRAAPVLSASTVQALVDLRPGSHVALAAEIDGDPVGIVRWIRHRHHRAHAEIALEVIDAVHGRGIGRRLTAAAARSALDAGIECFTCWVAAAQGRLRDRLLSLGAEQAADDPDQFRLHPAALLAGTMA
ncbi:N-acetyltransferase family protein [Nakamurella sp. GG22]